MIRSWRVNYAALWLSQLMSMLSFGIALPFMPLYIQSLGIADPREAVAWAATLNFASGMTMALMGPIWGAVADRYGRKTMLVRAMLGGGSVVGVMGFVSSVQQLVVLRFVQGGFSGTVSAARTLAASIVPRERLGSALGLMATAAFIGTSIGPLIGGVLADTYGYAICFVVTGLLMVVSGLAVILFVHERVEHDESTTRQKPGLRESLAFLAGRPQLHALVGGLILVQIGQMAASPVLPLFVRELSGTDENVASTTGAIIGIAAVSSAFAAAFAGHLGDQIGHRRVLIICALGSGLLYLPQAFATAPWHLLVLRGALGIFQGGLIPTAMAIIGLTTPSENRGVVFGLTATAHSLGNAFGPIIGAAFVGIFGLRAAFVVTAVLLTLGGVWLAQRSVGPEPSPTLDPAGGT